MKLMTPTMSTPDRIVNRRGKTIYQWAVAGIEGYPIAYTVNARYPWTVRTGNHDDMNTRILQGKKDQAEAQQWILENFYYINTVRKETE